MKEFLFRIWDIQEDTEYMYRIKAEDATEAEEKFVEKCIPLCYKTFDYSSMLQMFQDSDIEIKMFSIDKIINL